MLDQHDTALSAACFVLGMCWIVQLVPFHRWASVARPDDPTAMQAFFERHDTPASTPDFLGTRCTVQCLPSHRSASGAVASVEFVHDPTAIHTLDVGHETPRKLADFAPAGLAMVWIVQVVPFQRSARAILLPALLNQPTAVQAVLEAHDTPSRTLSCAPAGFGVRCNDQPDAFAAAAPHAVSWSVQHRDCGRSILRHVAMSPPASMRRSSR